MFNNNPLPSLPVLLVVGVLVGISLSSTVVQSLSTHMHLENLTSALLVAVPLGLTAGLLKKL